MKTRIFILSTIVLFSTSLFAEDFIANGIYYNFLDYSSVEVTYRGSSYSSYSNEYSGSISIPDTVEYDSNIYYVTAIDERAFAYCSNLTDVTICEQITTISDYAFYACSNLKGITIPNSVRTIGDLAFYNCSSLTEIVIPNSVNTIGYSAIRNCYNLTTVTIPNNVRFIGEWAFCECPSLVSINVAESNSTYHSAGNCIITTATKMLHTGCKNSVIPTDGSVTRIGDNVFYGCSNLTSIIIPNSITYIGDKAFYECSGLAEITIPHSVTTIGSWAFLGCTSLTKVTCEAVSPPTRGKYTFNYVDKTVPLYVPAESVEAYKSDEYWNEFTNIFPISNVQGGIEMLCDSVSTGVRKVIEDGQVIIISDGVRYNVLGTKM